ncbi:bifunctional ADP-dependent NAD(P)H-hydrate dehydratase/NAD(P)H-hydrate epimerase [Bacillus canaveralius]|uniref:Bifunctional NAD(P)H-hydrate repair enzyme n=1 Tax=Bacillus canaveralius TaxID=1403243 RepID=A0A2N5GN65_9BACI|nr:NAD(P)H-hydrate dehydratase [Bacillus canaveralius]PLR83643.1 bifunctional ADP-dependent NAD(P)H-hydrate dehydratase/NAD(P)H-hydrate epimerase [Bacillus canaveralius]PLR94423.1 bifunctional ADP-dependent NAD(P)H-hydrate dehydratase/NAD(P)H-hydrate epimerase [Bacillus canaveralius]
MFVAGQREMQQIDQYTIEKIGLPGVVLMENAGAKVVEEILASSPCQNPRVVVLSGGGNNGGDGFVIARRLFDLGFKPLLCLLVNPDRIKGDAKSHLDVYINRGFPIFHLEENTLVALQNELNQADIIIDAMLGTGVNGPVREPFKQVISMVNAYEGNKLVIAVDIPSGVSSDNGKVEGVAIKAVKTITFVFPKKGFFLDDGPKYVGEWKAVDISVPHSVAEDLGLLMPKLITEPLVKTSVPIRPQHGHKGTFGHALVLGGSRQFVGAPIFAAKAALHSGAGLVTLAVPENIYPMAAAQNPESLFLPLSDKDGHFSEKAIDEISPNLHQFDSVAIGPGMSRFVGGEEWIRSLITALENQSVVIDADALYLLRNELDMIRQYKGNVIFTPHPGEMARLLDKTVQEVEDNRIETATTFAKKYHVYLLLKGHRSVIATPDGDVYINPHGHDALGKGGSGDVLTGLITSFLAQGVSPLDALIAASYLHAKAAEQKAKSLSHYGVMPLDIIDGVREQLNQIT